MNVEILERVEKTTKKAPKEALLAQLDEQGQRLVKMALDPDITFGITVDEDAELVRFQPKPVIVSEHFWECLERALGRFRTRDLTGNAALDEASHVLSITPDKVALKWAARILNRQLRAGFDIRTFNKVFGEGSVKKFAVQLADTYNGEELRGVYYVQPKLDGNRVVFIDEKAMSRNGKEYPNCEHVINELISRDKNFFKKWVLDGEMMGDLGFDKSSGALRRVNEKNREKATFTYYAFDLITKNEWDLKKTRPIKARLQDLEDIIGKRFSFIKVVPTFPLTSPTHKQLMECCDQFVSEGFEGAMAKDSEAPYCFKRGKNLLKVKRFFDVDLRVVGSYEGKGKHKGRLGGLIVEGDGVHCEVGSGFSDDLRETIWNDPQRWLGATVQVQAQDRTVDGSLRFPVFCTRRKDKE